jgi:UDP-glucose:(heptosyl)LPS alpha-1,3-glucosyltransferase
VILHADRARGGAERYTSDLLLALRRAGHDAKVAAASFSDEIPADARRPLPHTGPTRSARYRSFCRGLDALVGRERFDVVHAMLPVPNRCDVYHPHAGIAAGEVRAKPLQAILNPRRHLFASVERAMLTRPAPPVVLCLSNYVKADVRRHYPSLPEDRMVRLFNAVDLAKFSPGPAHEPAEVVDALIIAQDFARKGVATLIRALPAARGVRVTVVGRDRSSAYERLARRLGVRDRVRFVGGTSDVLGFYREADVFVLPTKHDPCSLVVLEALACGLPVISTRFNGACEVMTDGIHGFVLNDATDPAPLAAALNRVADPATRASMRAACVALRPTLSYGAHLATLTNFYERVGPDA